MSEAFDPETVSEVLDFGPDSEGGFPMSDPDAELPGDAAEAADAPAEKPDILRRVWDGLMAPVPDTPVAEVNSAFDGEGEWHQHLSLAIQGLTQAGGEPVVLHLIMAAGKYILGPTTEGKPVEVQDDETEWGMVEAEA